MKKTLSLLLATLMVMLSIPMTAAAEEGVPEGYIPVRTVEDLYNVRNDLTANYIMMNDIDLTEATAEGGDWDYMGNGWDPIGSGGVYGSNEFSGVFDGNGYSIIGMRIDVTTWPKGVGNDTCIGLFANVSGTIQNLSSSKGCINVARTIEGGIKQYISSICGYNSGTIHRVLSDNTITIGITDDSSKSISLFIGGIAGRSTGNISQTANIGKIDITFDSKYGYDGSDQTTIYGGGITGHSSNVSESYNLGSISITSIPRDIYWVNGSMYSYTYATVINQYIGGISGYNSGSICNSYNHGQLSRKRIFFKNGNSYEYSGTSYLSGISNYGNMTNCYNTGCTNTYTVKDVETSSKGYGVGDGTVSNVYYLSGTGTNTTGAVELSAGQMKLKSVFSGFDFENTWMIVPYGEYPYPQLRSNPQNLLEKIEKIEIQSLPEKQIYRLNETPTFDGGQILATYASGNTEVIDITADMVTGIDTSVEGEQTATVTHRGCTATFDVYVTSSFMTELALVSKPSTTVYLEGDELNLAGMVVSANFADESSFIVEDYTVSGYDSTPGTKNVTISFNGYEVSFDVKVIAKTLTSVKLTTLPTKTVYLEGDELDMTGAVLTAYYNNNTNAPVTDYTVSGYDSTPGEKTVVLKHGSKTTSFKVTVEAKSLSGIEVTTLPSKLVYLEGDSFDPTGIIVTAYYNNGTSGEITDYELSGYDSTPGDKTIIVSCGDYTTFFDVKVTAKALTSIAVTKLPRKVTYLEGDKFDAVGLEITAYYNNGTSEIITDYELTGFTSTPGVNTIAVSYLNKITTFTVNVNAKSMTEIVVSVKPAKLTYLEGDSFDADGMKVIARYDNNTESEITDYTVNGYDSAPGTKLITVSYNGFEAQFTVSVTAKTMTGIEIVNKPSKLTYLEGDTFNPAGLTVKALYDNGDSENVTDYTVTGYDSTPGSKTITVSYNKFNATFTVQVQAKSLTEIVITAAPAKTEYIEGQILDTEGLVVTANYNNGTSEKITNYSLSGYKNTVGTHTVTVSYGGKTATFDVRVIARVVTAIEVTKMPNKVEYLEGDEIALAGLEVTATYNDGTTEKVTDYICNGYDSTPGEKTISVMYSGCTASFTVNVKAKSFTHITITYPTKLTYFVGEELDTAGMTVTAFYDNGTFEVIESGKYAIEGFDSSAVGTKDVTVSYNGKTQSFSVTIVEAPKTILYGDVTGDGKINLTDVSTILKHIAKWDIEMNTDAADVTGDGKINLTDVSTILKYIAKWDVVLGK